MTRQEIERTTVEYYSCFCGTDLSQLGAGTHLICTADRDRVLSGFGCKYTAYLFVRDELLVISCSPRYRDWMEGVRGAGRKQIVAAANRRFRLKRKRLMLFEKETAADYGRAKLLRPGDYPLYESFFRAAHPDADPAGWLREYFTEKTEQELFAGYLSGGKLLSVCDAPDMPYMAGRIQHTGIYTLKEARRKGCGACTAALEAHHLLEKGICPQWECDGDNTASAELAKSIGYREYADAYILEE